MALIKETTLMAFTITKTFKTPFLLKETPDSTYNSFSNKEYFCHIAREHLFRINLCPSNKIIQIQCNFVIINIFKLIANLTKGSKKNLFSFLRSLLMKSNGVISISDPRIVTCLRKTYKAYIHPN